MVIRFDVQNEKSAKLALPVLQVLGLFTTLVTAIGCLYFIDQGSVASSKGLMAAGVLVLVLNIFFLVVMAVLISKKGARSIKEWAVWLRQQSSKIADAAQNMWRGKSGKSQQGLQLSTTGSLSSSASGQVTLLNSVFTHSSPSIRSEESA